MLVVKLLPFMENLSSRKWSDSDILEDIDYVKERLQENFQSLTWVRILGCLFLISLTSFFLDSTFEQYASEIETGKLEWSPPHKSEAFWKENYSRLEEHNYQLLRYEKGLMRSFFSLTLYPRALARILSTSTSPVILAVGANDVGQYSKYASKAGKRLALQRR